MQEQQIDRMPAKRWRATTPLLSLAIAALLSLNALTLLNDTIHSKVFNLVSALLTSVLPGDVASGLLRHSPAVRIAAKKDVAERVAKRVARRATANAIKNVISVAAEVVPFLGAAAVIGLTTSDLYDDCQTIKDMNELNATFGSEKQDEFTVCGMKVPFVK